MALNFELILFALVVFTGALWALEHFYAKKHRETSLAEPFWVEWGASFFPVLFIVFVFRVFFFEPFRIPSGSMTPTLLAGDFILVNKYHYGIRLPVLKTKLLDINQPQRGDVMVFRYPEDPSLDYIKRVIGVPGDTVAYEDKRLTINGSAVPTEKIADYLHSGKLFYSQQYIEKFGTHQHNVLNDSDAPAMILSPLYDTAVISEDDLSETEAYQEQFSRAKNCRYSLKGITCKVPSGHYFVMGDNRDNSKDSRYWGFVPESHIVGRAVYVWMHFESLLPPKGVNFGRIGAID